MKKVKIPDEIQYLGQNEMLEVTGGVVWYVPILIAAACAAVEEVIRDWDNFKAGLLGKPEIQK